MATQIAFTISIKGDEKTVQTVTEVQRAIKQINSELKKTEDIEGIKSLEKDLLIAKVAMKELRNQQKQFIQETESKKFAEGSYRQLNAELGSLKNQFKDLSKAEREGAVGKALTKRIQELDSELKKVDANIGQFQRNVGNYPKKILASIEATVPGFAAFKEQIDNIAGSAGFASRAIVGGFVAFQAGKFIYQSIAALGDFINEIEKTKKIVQEFSGAYGEDLDRITADTNALAATFEVDSKDIAKSANALSQELGISFEEALGQIEKGLVSGQASNEDYLNSISEAPEKFKEAGAAVSEFSQANREALEANKELAAAQIEIANRFSSTTQGVQNFATKIKTFLINALLFLIDLFQPLTNALGRFFSAIGSVISSLSGASKSTNIFSAALSLFIAPIKLVINLLSGLVGWLADVWEWTGNLIKDTPILSAAVDFLASAFQGLADFIANLPQYLQDAADAVGNFIATSLDYITFGFYGKATSAVSDLAAQMVEKTKTATAEVQATTSSYLSELLARAKMVQAEANTLFEQTKKAAVESEAAAKKREEAQQKSLDNAKKIHEERKKILEEETKQDEQRNALILQLQNQLIDAQINNLQNEQSRRLAEIEKGFNEQVAQLKANYDKLIQESKTKEKEYIRLFGENSEQLKKVRAQGLEDALRVQELVNANIVELENKKAADIAQINKDALTAEAQKQIEFLTEQKAIREKILSDTLGKISQAEQLALLRSEEATARSLSKTQDIEQEALIQREAQEKELAIRLLAIREKLNAVLEQQALQKLNIEVGISVPQEEIDATILQAQTLQTELAKLEQQQTELVQAESQKRAEARNEEFQKIGNYANQAISFVNQIEDVFIAREEKRLEEKQEIQQQSIDDLNTQLETATGLEKRFLLEQKRDEEANLKSLEAEKAAIEKRAAQQKKATAIITATINTALAVSAALATPPAPNVIAAAFAGVLGAAQIALIAAQPLANGGVVGTHISGQGIPTQPNGDNVLTTLRRGEVVLNNRQQAALGGARTFASIGVPGFAAGGVVSAPQVGSVIQSNSEIAQALQNQANAIQKMVSNITVSLDTDVLERTQKQKTAISKNTKLF